MGGTEYQLDEEIALLRSEIKQLRAIISAEVGGERPGDTLVRLADKIKSCRESEHVKAEDWRDWLRDYGRRLNEAAEAITDSEED